MANQTLVLNASAFYMGCKALEKGAKVLFGSDSIKDRSNTWSSVSTEKGYLRAVCKAAQVIIGQDSFVSRISNFTKSFVFASTSYSLANLSTEVSKAQETVGKIKNEIAITNQTEPEAENYIEAAYANNLLANLDQLFKRIKNMTPALTKCLSSEKKCKTALTSCQQETDGIKDLRESAKCFPEKKLLRAAQNDLKTANETITRLENRIKPLKEKAECKTLNETLAKVQAELEKANKTNAELEKTIKSLEEKALCTTANKQLNQTQKELNGTKEAGKHKDTQIETLRKELEACEKKG